MDDPIVNEVRKLREAILEKFGGDLNKFFKYIREEENKNPKKLAARRLLVSYSLNALIIMLA
ncbi:MAG: hypothetical protein K6U04_02310 [Armatimonadetes bacterium]|nr:hypothetical protein [Armatimonadota bacterium]